MVQLARGPRFYSVPTIPKLRMWRTWTGPNLRDESTPTVSGQVECRHARPRAQQTAAPVAQVSTCALFAFARTLPRPLTGGRESEAGTVPVRAGVGGRDEDAGLKASATSNSFVMLEPGIGLAAEELA